MSTAAPPQQPAQGRSSTAPASPSARRARPPLSTKKKIAFLTVVLALAWVGAEGAICLYLRANGFYWSRSPKSRLVNEMPNNLRPNPRYIWEYEQGSSFTYSDPRDKATYHVEINSEGFRDEEPAARAGAAFQFVALGDSFTFGWLVEHSQRWDEVLAQTIHDKHGITAASVNRGMWMTTFDQHALILEDHCPEQCAAVIHFVYPSHLQTINRHHVDTKDGTIVSIYDPMLHLKDNALFFGAADTALIRKQMSFPFSWCLWTFRRNVRQLREKIDHTHSVPEMTDEQIYQKESQPVFAHGYELMERSIAQTSAFLKARGVPYFVVIIPRDRQVHELEWNTAPPIREILETSIPQERIYRACAATGHAVCLDLLPAMRKKYHDKLYYRHDSHWRPEGHQLAAEQVLGLLEQRGVLSAYHATSAGP